MVQAHDTHDGRVRLRSDEWFVGNDETALAHRAALRSAGAAVTSAGGRPVIGIVDTASDLNPCNLPLRDVLDPIREGVLAAGGVPVVLPAMSLGEDLMKPTAMLYRNLLAMEIEENLRAYPLDGVVLGAGCDKTVPACLMGAASFDLPSVAVLAGSRPDGSFRGRTLRAGTDLWRYLEDFRAARMSEEDWDEFEACYACGRGSCNTMGTASSMAIVTEALGMALPGTALTPADDPDRKEQARRAGTHVVHLVRDDVRPSAVLTGSAFDRAIAALCAAGGSTNAILHLVAIAGRVGIDLPLDRFADIASRTPVIADVAPVGRHTIRSLHQAGGVPALLDAPTSAGTRPISAEPAFAVVRGSLAPDGAVLKACAADPGLFRHRGPAIVFDDYHDMRRRLDDPAADITEDTVLVLRGCGPVGAPGMPEWGMIPIPVRLAERGVTDMVRITDARMSGTSFGTCFLHVAPESAVGGPLALVRDGDPIVIDVAAGRLDLDLPEKELQRRRAAWSPPPSPHVRGWPALYRRTVLQAPQGCDLDFLRPCGPAERVPVSPVVGRS